MGKYFQWLCKVSFGRRWRRNSIGEGGGSSEEPGRGCAPAGALLGGPPQPTPPAQLRHTDQETQQTARPARGLFLWKALFLKMRSLCILVVEVCCQKPGLVNLSLPSPSQGNWWGERLYFIKPCSKTENIHGFVSPQTERAGIKLFWETDVS